MKFASQVALVIYPDCQLSAIYGLTDLFRLSSQWVGEDRRGSHSQIRVSHWRLDGDDVSCVFDTHPGAGHVHNYVIVPPSIIEPQSMQNMQVVAKWMHREHEKGATLASVCAGAFVLAETGLIDNRTATTHWAFAETLSKRFPKIKVAAQNMVVDDGDIITAGGILAWTDLGLTIVGKVLGNATMLATARFLLVDPPRQQQSVYQSFIPKFDHGDDAIRAVQHMIHADLANVPAIADLALRVGMSERTFLRRFHKATGLKPLEYLQQARIMKARSALELTNKTIDEIAYSVGYSDTPGFRKIFLKVTGILPTHYRQRFGVATLNH